MEAPHFIGPSVIGAEMAFEDVLRPFQLLHRAGQVIELELVDLRAKSPHD